MAMSYSFEDAGSAFCVPPFYTAIKLLARVEDVVEPVLTADGIC